MSSLDDPYLPLELIREILELAVADPEGEIGTVLLVAREVKYWIEPFRFCVVQLDKSRRARFFVDTIRTKERLARGVRHIALQSHCGWTVDDALDVLRRCPNTRDLGLTYTFNGPEMLPSLATLAPRRLTGTLFELFGASSRIDPLHPAFSQMTHLALFDGEQSEESSTVELLAMILDDVCRAAVLLPSLTHLRFQILEVSIMTALQDRLEDLLKSAPHLQCLLLRIPDNAADFGADPDDLHAIYKITDPRVVFMRDELTDEWVDWTEGALGGDDLWALADDFIAAKRAKDVSADEFWMENWWESE